VQARGQISERGNATLPCWREQSMKTVSVVDYHVAGEPLRIVKDVVPVHGATMEEKR
jgi:hypothetical protein